MIQVSNSELRSRARAQLSQGNNYWVLLGINVLVSLSLAIGTSVVIGGLIFYGVLTFGVSYVLLSIVRGGYAVFENMFIGFRNFVETMLLGIMVQLFTFLWTLLFFVPGIVKAYSYSMSFYIMMDEPGHDWQYCMNKSQQMMNGKKGDLFLLDLSFIGWILLSILTCGIGAIFLAPYMSTARANFYESIKG